MRNHAKLVVSLTIASVVFVLGSCGFRPDLIIKDVNLVDTELGVVQPHTTVKVRKGVVSSVKRHRTNTEASNRPYLMPGLIDAHGHPGDSGRMGWLDELLQSYMSQGVTTIRDCGGDERTVKAYLARRDSGKAVGPMIYYSSFWAGPRYFRHSPRQETHGWPTPDAPWNMSVAYNVSDRQIDSMVVEAKRYGCTGLKLYTDLAPDLLQRIIKVCHSHGLQAWGHAEALPSTPFDVAKAGEDVMSHAYLMAGMKNYFKADYSQHWNSKQEQTRRDLVFTEMKRRGAIFDPTVVASQSAVSFNITKEAYRKGLKIDAGSDLIDSYSIYPDELRLLHDSCGLTNADVLRAATVTGAETVGQQGKRGIIRKGAWADMLLLRGNPLESLSALKDVDALYIEGKKVDLKNKQ